MTLPQIIFFDWTQAAQLAASYVAVLALGIALGVWWKRNGTRKDALMLADKGNWKAHFRAAYYDGDVTAEQIATGLTPIDVREAFGNILVNIGIGLLEDLLIGAGGTVYSNANAHIGIGDSTTAAAAAQTDLQAGANKFRRPMDATFPSRAGQVLTFRSTFGLAEGNFSIQEAGVFNAAAAGTMLNRRVQDLGVKTAASTLQLTVSITIS